ncbi:MAG: DUF5696 domain-containing protein [Eubacteriales bacterium]
MKKRIISAILAVIMVFSFAGVFSVGAAGTDVKFANEEEKLASMTLAATSDNGEIQLYYAAETGEIAVKNTKTGDIFLSNPYDVNQKGISDSTERGKYLSQIIVDYRYVSQNWAGTYSSYKDATLCDQMEITKTDKGLSVRYLLGEVEKELILPLEISEETLQNILGRIEDDYDREFVESMYSPKKSPSEMKLYMVSVANQRSRIYAASVIESVGFTLDDVHAEYDKIGYARTDREIPQFDITIDYTVTNDGFTVDIDASKISYDMSKYYITSMVVLPFFSAADRTDTGYNFIPDGSGAIVRFEDVVAKSSLDSIVGTVYGNDFAYYNVSAKNMEQYVFPVFGLSNTTDKKGFFAIIEDGDAMSNVVSAHSSLYHSAYATFNLLATDTYDLADSFSSGVTDSKEITVRAEDIYRGNCRIRYSMLTAKEKAEANSISSYYDTSYIGMAKYYRDYLISKGAISKFTSVGDKSKVFFEVFGSCQAEEKFLTFPITVNKELTTFEDVKTIHKELSDAGIGNMSFILTGFANGGLNSYYPTSIKWQKVLGGKAGFTDLLSYASENGIEIAPNIDFTYTKTSKFKAFSGFSLKKNGAQTLDGRYTTRRNYDPALQLFVRTGGIAISSGSYQYAYDKFYSSISEYSDLKFLAVRTLASDVNSDFDKDDIYLRQASLENTVEMLKKLTGENGNNAYNLIGDKGNAYALAYFKSLLNVSLESSRVLTESESVPFIGIVLHGSVNFAGNAINMEGDERYAFLKCLENGSSLYYTIAMQNVEALKFNYTYSKYYSVKYETWKDKIIETYNEYNAVMSSKQNQYITEHEFLNTKYGFDVKRSEDGKALDNSRIVRVEYENGEGFILNYNSYDVTVVYEGTTYNIESLGYIAYSNN